MHAICKESRKTRLGHPEASGSEVFDMFDAMYVPAALQPWNTLVIRDGRK
jgi:hypothetical protein